jgi:hypothetical protein
MASRAVSISLKETVIGRLFSGGVGAKSDATFGVGLFISAFVTAFAVSFAFGFALFFVLFEVLPDDEDEMVAMRTFRGEKREKNVEIVVFGLQNAVKTYENLGK